MRTGMGMRKDNTTTQPEERPMRELLLLVAGKLAAVAHAGGHDAEAEAILGEVRERIERLPESGAQATGTGTERAVAELMAYAAECPQPSRGPTGAALHAITGWVRMRSAYLDNPTRDPGHRFDENVVTDISNLRNDLAYIDDGFNQDAERRFCSQPIMVESGESETPLLRLTFEMDSGDASVGDPGYACWMIDEDQSGTLFGALRPGQLEVFVNQLEAQSKLAPGEVRKPAFYEIRGRRTELIESGVPESKVVDRLAENPGAYARLDADYAQRTETQFERLLLQAAARVIEQRPELAADEGLLLLKGSTREFFNVKKSELANYESLRNAAERLFPLTGPVAEEPDSWPAPGM